jgi:hypothetical protein
MRTASALAEPVTFVGRYWQALLKDTLMDASFRLVIGLRCKPVSIGAPIGTSVSDNVR